MVRWKEEWRVAVWAVGAARPCVLVQREMGNWGCGVSVWLACGERIWVCLDGQWTTTDAVPRPESPDPRRVSFLREGVRSERTVIPVTDFPSVVMPEQACHPLMIAEMFGGLDKEGRPTTAFRWWKPAATRSATRCFAGSRC